MEAQVHTLFSSDYYSVYNFKCQCQECGKSKIEFNRHFTISFIRTGNFYYHTYRNTLDSFTGCALVSKANVEYAVTHAANMPDECTILSFTNEFYEQIKAMFKDNIAHFLNNPRLQTILLKLTPETELLHDICLKKISSQACEKLAADEMVMQLLHQVIESFSHSKKQISLPDRLKKYHLATTEVAKQYILENFTQNISLIELANHCKVSPFHFSRIFKSFTNYSPYQYLQLIRLKQAALLLQTNLPIADVAFLSGFNSIDYFSSAFKKQYKLAPSLYKSTF